MAKNFNFKMVNGFSGTMNNVNEIAQLVKAELLNTNNVVVVNGFRFWIGGAEGAEGYVLYVETLDGNPNPFERKCFVHKIYHLGKIRRGIDKYVADFLTLNAEYGMYNTPMFVWEDGKMVEYVELNNMVDMVNSVDMTGIDENGLSVAGLDYVNENMRVVDVDMIKECIEECVEDLCLTEDGKKMNFEGFCDVLWTNYVWDRVLDSGCTDEALENETRYVMEFNDRVRYIVENDIDMLYINCYDEIGVDDMVKNNPPCLERVADTIENYLKNYTPSYLDKFGDCVICVYWDEFNEEDMNRLIEDDNFAMSVRDSLYRRGLFEKLSDFLVYDDGVYVTVDYDKMFNKVA